jgi:hypothetical protein
MNLDAVKARLNKLSNKNSRADNLWKPEEGKNVVRIVPYIHQKEYPFIEAYFHWGIAKKRTLVSPVTTGDADPIVEFADKLRSQGDKESIELSKKLYPKMRTYVPVVVRGKEHEGVKFWGFGKTVYEELLKIIADPDYGDITDPSNGRDITVDFEKGKVPTDNKTSVRPKPNTSAITDDEDVIKKLADQPNFLEDIYQVNTYEDLEKALNEYLQPEEGEETATEASTTTSEPASEPTAKTSTPEPTKTEDVSKAFDSLFNK